MYLTFVWVQNISVHMHAFLQSVFVHGITIFYFTAFYDEREPTADICIPAFITGLPKKYNQFNVDNVAVSNPSERAIR